MASAARSAFRVHRLDAPHRYRPPGADPGNYRAFWVIGGRAHRVRTWNMDQWLRIPEGDRPRVAFPVAGPAFMAITPLGG